MREPPQWASARVASAVLVVSANLKETGRNDSCTPAIQYPSLPSRPAIGGTTEKNETEAKMLALSKARTKTNVGHGVNLPTSVKLVLTNANATAEDMLGAAVAAEKTGYPQLAVALRRRAEKSSSGSSLIPSPWKDVTPAAWTHFSRVMATGASPAAVSPKGFFGLFQIGVRRLVDLGIMANPKSCQVPVARNGRTGVVRCWTGDWIIPKAQFLSDPAMQYDLFARSLDLYRNIIAEKYKQVLGLNIENKKATLSGLLAVAHMAGSEGMYKWLTEGASRKKFSWVTESFNKANGIF